MSANASTAARQLLLLHRHHDIMHVTTGSAAIPAVETRADAKHPFELAGCHGKADWLMLVLHLDSFHLIEAGLHHFASCASLLADHLEGLQVQLRSIRQHCLLDYLKAMHVSIQYGQHACSPLRCTLIQSSSWFQWAIVTVAVVCAC